MTSLKSWKSVVVVTLFPDDQTPNTMSLRRQTRLRKEYLYRKSLEGRERQNYERKERIKAALRAGKALPTELRNEEAQLRAEIEADDARTAMSGAPSSALGAAAALDDEYAKATARDPKIAVTTSRLVSVCG